MELPTLTQILNWVVIFFAGSGVCSLVSCGTPTNHKNTFLQWLLDGVNLWAFNIGKGENKDEKRA